MVNSRKVQPFDAFSTTYKILIFCGFYKLMHPTTRFKYICYQIYRCLAFMIIPIFSMQQIIHTIGKLKDNNIDDALDTFMLLPTQFNLLSKHLALNLHSSTVDRLNDVMRGPIFAARHQEDEIILTKFVSAMHKLCKKVQVGIGVCGLLYILSPIFQKIHDPTITIPTYYPFETNDWGRYLIATFINITFLPWIAHGHVTLDCLIGIYYCQATVQLKLIKYNLEHLFDSNEANNISGLNMNHQYIDVVDKTVQKRFEHYVERYSKVKWYVQELCQVFGVAIVYQIASTVIIVCILVYKMSTMEIFSVRFIFIASYIIILQVQILLYCYYGGLVKIESLTVNDSLYMSQWVSASPKFRRQMLIAMAQWMRPLTPRVLAIVPLSLNTFVSMVRFIYSLYTGLISTN